ncbi:acyl-CoA dehydrogenase family protein [Mycolicibacterium grossiae]|uniref:Acyl-CoA dehydrogenase n=1 Tax=Mycolicibacterium grossiae TaxID=1552759 RepID=A0A1E8Q320_9MYCO|nr:acyl-CoA dehydrogenase family protein [Mycolicibacterium grossiae]OFJ52895.1 acyl-CoA dehydrogenase [Mycolicibacterium grossiae]QEM44651.1 acyl-CoA dehydrogenase [Mycolicibacterium grossiae]
MKLALSDDDVAFREELREFIATEIPADVRERGRAGHPRFPDDIVTCQRLLNARGWAVPGWPVEWGGQDWTPIRKQIWADELQMAGVPEPLAFNASMVGPVIAQFGSEDVKKRFLPPTANLDIWWCQGFSEPEAGSDLASLRTTAVRDGDDYVINGQKTWTTLGQYADWIFVLARTNPDAPKRQAGISFLLAEMNTPGITLRPIKLIDGGYEVNEVFFDDVRVPADQLVGEENAGWTYAKYLLSHERSGIARIGMTKRWLVQAKQHAAQVRVNGASLLEDPLFAARVAELENEVLALEITQRRVGGSEADGKPNPASSILKLRGSQLQQAATELLLEVAGPDAVPSVAGDAAETDDLAWAHEAAPHYLNYRKTSIYGGTNEVQRTIIASTILGL